MTETQSASLDDALSRWHSWQHGAIVARGWAPKALVCGDYQVSRQYDDGNGALDSDIDDARCRQVDHDVREMQDPHRSAVYCHARNLSTGRTVWASPRLPQCRAARAALVAESLQIIARRLVASGII